MKFKINVGRFTEYRPDASLELPSNDRQLQAWGKTLTEAYNYDYAPAEDTPLLPNNWYWDKFYTAAAGSYPQDIPASGISSGTWVASVLVGGGWSTSLDADTSAYNGYRLTIDGTTAGTDNVFFKHDYSGSDWFDNVNNAVGYTVLWRCKVIDAGSSRGQYVLIDDGTYLEHIILNTGDIKIGFEGTTYPINTTSAYRTYKAVVLGTNLKLYIDDSSTASIDVSISNASSAKKINWGDISASANEGGNVHWDFMTYYTGAEPTLFGTDQAFFYVRAGKGALPFLSGTALSVVASTATGDRIYVRGDNAGLDWVTSVDNAEGYVVEAICQVVTAGLARGQQLLWDDGVYRVDFSMLSGNIIFVGSTLAAGTTTYVMDTTDDFHTYKFVVEGSDLKFYVDGLFILEGTLNNPVATKAFSFGNLTATLGWGGNTKWLSVKYKLFREAFAGVIACTSGSVPSEYSLDIDTVAATAPNDNLYFAHDSGTAPFHLNASNERGYTIEVLKKLIDARTVGGQVVYWQDNLFKEALVFGTGFVGLKEDGTTYPITTTDDFHRYRATVKGSVVNVYVDDVLRIEGAMSVAGTFGGNMGIYFGDYFSTYGGESRWAYIKYNLEAALAPNLKANDGWVFASINDLDKRRVTERNVIRSDNSIVPTGKMRAKKIALNGTLVGSDYPSFRDSLRRLKRILNVGQQKISIDDERFVEGLHTDFSLTPITKSFARFRATMLCRYPFYQQEWAEYFSTSPVSAATFYITNDGDIEVPAKIIITGAAAGTIDDNIDIRNATLTQQGVLRAVLQQTSELVIDKGFDIYNDYKVEVGGAASFGSYEGDLITLAPGENALVFTGGAVGTIEIYWRSGFMI